MAAPGSQQQHSNLYVRGWLADRPLTEADVVSLFSAHGDLTSIRIVPGGEAGGGGAAAPHAFVRYEHPSQAAAAIQALNGICVNDCQLVVKFADADVQPRVESGRQPSEWCYCRNLPSNYGRQDVGEMFVPFGTVLEIRLFPSTELYKGSGALVQMQSMEQAAAAIQSLNGSFPRGATQPLLVRYADSPAEKAAKQARKERMIQKQATTAGIPGFGNGSLLAAQLQQQLLGLTLNGGHHGMGSSMGGSPDLSVELTSPIPLMDGFKDSNGVLPQGVLQQQATAAALAGSTGGASIYIKGMPEDSDKLWLYEKFARFGGISSVRVLIDEQTGKCNGIGFVNYVSGDAARLAQEAMNGVSMGDRLLHVMIQNSTTRGGRAGPPNGSSPLTSGSLGSANGGGGGMQMGPSSSQLPSVMQAANSLGLSASAFASLQAGLMPSATSGMPNGLSALSVGGQGYGMGGSQHANYAHLPQW